MARPHLSRSTSRDLAWLILVIVALLAVIALVTLLAGHPLVRLGTRLWCAFFSGWVGNGDC